VIGMLFYTLTDVVKFYKWYAHETDFSIHIGQHTKENEKISFKRYYCSREGFNQEKVTDASDESGEKNKT
jgi:hypothetical protein